MNTLLNQINEISDLSVVLKSSSENSLVIEEYGLIHSILESSNKNLSKIIKFLGILKSLPHDFNITKLNDVDSECLETSLYCFNSLFAEWESKDYLVRQDNILDDTTSAITSLFLNTSTHFNESWSSWINSLQLRFEILENLLDSHENIPSLTSSITSYRLKKNQFIELSLSKDINESDIPTLIKLCDDLIALKDNMDFDLPDDVKKFFKAMSHSRFGTRVTLCDITPEVLDWLKENNALSNYLVTQKTGY